ncbi:thiopeptide-type bacteriocin biosynthesis protein [Mucilaginibacter oryzae]|uniref:Thiopeptide-type bacteriocin biosynthesis protein n=1 Tax=Mucilaginibacter oryzae TaxID=468058 RepID=A0A316GZN0_9SPHI|nr:lantibiotic dehydratase [Mucilaginibacter oryzae]PWK70837.1 thiopeptide-type bacteriocin biosynthesis protein [Mucilaginibacter oryzae]
MNLSFHQQIFVRTANESFDDFNYDDLRVIIKERRFQHAIFFASETLHSELHQRDFVYDDLPEKVRTSLKKYYNRLCFRATPFGLFASTGIISWGKNHGASVQTLSRSAYIYPDFPLLLNIYRDEATRVHDLQTYLANNTIYRVSNGYRYISFIKDINGNRFQLNSLERNSFLSKILIYGREERTKQQLVQYCVDQGVDSNEAAYFIKQAIDGNLFYQGLVPRHVGEPYFLKLFTLLDRSGMSDSQRMEIIDLFSRPYKQGNIPLMKILEIGRNFRPRHPLNKFYVNSTATFNNCLPEEYQAKIMEGLMCLDRLSSNDQPPALKKFKKDFLARFDKQVVSLANALDPELGIGYADLAAKISDNILLEDLHHEPVYQEGNPTFGPLHQLLVKKLQQAQPYESITLNDNDLDMLPLPNSLFPPSFSVLFQLKGEFVVMEKVGGVSGAALPARFAVFNKDLEAYTNEIVSQEQKINDQVVFAEVSAMIDGKAANVVTRNKTYEHEISILLAPSVESHRNIGLDDLYISVVDDKIILRSRKLNKVIIPRFSSAFNYNRHDLSIFRFLCDLQYQSVKSDFSFSFLKLFPGLSFYPRLVYKFCIISRATWVIGHSELNLIFYSPEPEIACKQLWSQINLATRFTISDQDNEIFFDQKWVGATALFISMIKNKTSLTLKEAILPESTMIKDMNGRSLANEMVACIINRDNVYSPVPAPPTGYPKRIGRGHIPGDEWLYYKLYGAPVTLTKIIEKPLYDLIRKLSRSELLNQWFFIRYYDPMPHLRIRIRLDRKHLGRAIPIFNAIFNKLYQSGALSLIQLDTYSPELERYGIDHYPMVENIFQSSSRCAMKFARHYRNGRIDNFSLGTVLLMVHHILLILSPDLPQRQKITHGIVCRFSEEFIDKPHRVLLNQKFRKCKGLISDALEGAGETKLLNKLEFGLLLNQIRSLNVSLSGESSQMRLSLFTDIIHMHLNRLFMEEQRRQEFVIYYLLEKYYTMMLSRNKS